MALWTEQTEHVSSYVDIKHIIIYIYILPSPLERKMKHDIVQPSQYATPAIWSPKVLPQWRSMCWQAADCLPGINSPTPGSH